MEENEADSMPALPKRYRHRLHRILNRDSQRIAELFFLLSNSTQNALISNGVSLVKLKAYAARYPLIKKESKLTLAHIVQPADDLLNVFVILETNNIITFYKFKLLEWIIRDLCPEQKEELEKYKKEFRDYVKRRVSESSLYYGGAFNPGEEYALKEGCNLVLITDDIWNQETALEAVFELEEYISDVLGIEEFVLALKAIEANCLHLYHSVPSCIELYILSVIRKRAEALMEYGIVEIQCGNKRIILKDCESFMDKYNYQTVFVVMLLYVSIMHRTVLRTHVFL